MHSFDAPVLLMSIPSEILILSYCNIFIIRTDIRLKKFVDTIYHFYVNIFSFSVLFKDKWSSESNLIFIKSIPYSPASPPFMS